MAGPTSTEQPKGVENPLLPLTTDGNASNLADMAATETTSSGLDADEYGLYDRQIRLWGAQAQQQIRSADILLISIRALGTEIAKNLTLAGINSLTIIDDDLVADSDLGAQYFLRDEDIGKPVCSPTFKFQTFATDIYAIASRIRHPSHTRTQSKSQYQIRR